MSLAGVIDFVVGSIVDQDGRRKQAIFLRRRDAEIDKEDPTAIYWFKN